MHDLNLKGAQGQRIKEVYATGTPVVMVLVSGKPFVLSCEKQHIPVILAQLYAGEQAGASIAEILFGEISPSGRLTFSFPRSTGHLPVYYDHLPSDRGFYKNPGSYDSPGRDYVFSSPSALWSFGHGLTYTTFAYNSLQLDKEHYQAGDTIVASVEVKNIGQRAGKEVVQLYVNDKVSSVVTPVHQLRGFEKIAIQPDETKIVTIRVPVNELYIVDNKNQRVLEAGEFEIQVGSAADYILLSKTIVIGDSTPVQNTTIKEVGKSSRMMTIKGEIRDVQATLIDNAEIIAKSTGEILGYSDTKGLYTVKAGNREILLFRKIGYQQQEIPITHWDVINVRLNYESDH